MQITVHIALLGWIPVVLALFAILPPRTAVISAFLGAWLFLPMAGYTLPGLPDYNKMSATSYGVLLGAAVFDGGRFLRLRASWLDAPILLWCLGPIVTSLLNGLGLKDGLSVSFNSVALYGMPYVIGRLYFADLHGLRALAIGIFIGGLIYVPLCLLEIRLSPNLHRWVYGYHQHSVLQTRRMGGYRPMVFMQHGLMVGMWMTAATLMGFWLWRGAAARAIMGVPVAWLLAALSVTTVLCRSLGALLLLAAGLATLTASSWFRTRFIVLALALVPVVYPFVRASGVWDGQSAAALVRAVTPERARSLETRFNAENLLGAKARERILFGWGGWNRSRVFNEQGRDIAMTDGHWIIALGQRGVVGLAGFTAIFVLPAVAFARRCHPRRWRTPALAAPGAIAVTLLLYAVDNLMNAMVNPLFFLASGGLTGLLVAHARTARAPAPGAGGATTNAARTGAAGVAARLAAQPARPVPTPPRA